MALVSPVRHGLAWQGCPGDTTAPAHGRQSTAEDSREEVPRGRR